MEKFLESVSFSAVDLSVLETSKPQLFKRILADVVNMYDNKIIRNITPTTVYPISELEKAMRQMQSGKHTGKIVIEANSDSIVQALPAPSPKAVKAGSAASYLITGGTGGIGRSIAKWLAEEGAKHIVLVSRSGMNQKGVPELVQNLQNKGVNIIVRQCDVADRRQVQELVTECQEADLPPIKGVVHGALVLRDVLLEKMTFSDWNLNIKPRVDGAWNLHHCLADVKLDFFIMLGSCAGICGNYGQAAYAASNTFLDAFAMYRKTLGLAATVIDLGLVANVGYILNHKEREAEVSSASHDRIIENEVLSLVKATITGAFTGNDEHQTFTGFRLSPNKPLPQWAADPKFSHLLAYAQSGAEVATDENKPVAVQHSLRQADSLEAAVELICRTLMQRISSLLAIAEEDVDRKKPVVAYGLDSLVAVELRNWITLELEANVPLMELMNTASVEKLAGTIANRSRLMDQSLFQEEEGKGEGY